MKEKYRKIVFFVVYSTNESSIEYLVLRRKMHWSGWEFPKGGIKFWETKKMAVKRELKEEVGLKPKKIIYVGLNGKYDYQKELPDRKGIKGQEYSLFAVEVKKEKIRLSKEHSSYKWLKFKEAYKKLTWQNQKKCLGIVEDKIKGKI
jgi:8-oxo-dGTP pyrophosphatase MutT (NUDIX family)